MRGRAVTSIREKTTKRTPSPDATLLRGGPKREAYHRAGVPHYWVIDPEHETSMVYRLAPEGYVLVLTAGREDVVRAEPFAAIEIRVGELFGES